MMLDNQFVNPMVWHGAFDSFEDVPSFQPGDVFIINGQEYLCVGIDVGLHDYTHSYTISCKPKNENDTFILAEYAVVEPLG